MALTKFPGFIDVHVHLRDPGATHKEDFYTGSRSAVKGGFTYILDMPNNPIPTFSPEALADKIQRSRQMSLCPVGFHYGTNGHNLETFPQIWGNNDVFGLKLYLNHTTGDFLIEDEKLIIDVFKSWNSLKPILVHAEGEKLEKAIFLTQQYGRFLHVCHISQKSEVDMLRKAKKQYAQLSAGVCPHHLFLTAAERKRKGGFALMKPPLGEISDLAALWEGIDDGTIDLVETDHAPHTRTEKMGETPLFGVPGLETAVGLLFKAVHDKRLRTDDVVRLLHYNPRKIFNIPVNDSTYVELDPVVPYLSGKNGYESKSGWSPFAQWELFGAVEAVVINGKRLVAQQKIVREGGPMGKEAFYAANRSYEANYDMGPFGLFRDLPAEIRQPKESDYFLGHKVDLPFGIPAGPLLNSRFVAAAWVWGFPIATYKTVRGNEYPCHPAPNVIKVISETENITPGQTVIGNLNTQDIDVIRDGITNSFGVPSKSPEIWQADVREVLKHMNTGNVLILSFMGTKREGMSFDEYVADFVKTAKLAQETGAPILEVNFSCPNVGKEGLICNDFYTSASILEALKSVRGNIPLLVKIGYFPKEQNEELKKLLGIIYEYADGVAAINTIQAKVVDQQGRQILPGSPLRIQSGICGAAIRWAGLEMAQRITDIKERQRWEDLTVIGVGGVVTPEDYFKYLGIGVDAVQSATGAMWRPTLAQEIRAQLSPTYEVPSSAL